MKDEYTIINKSVLEKRIEELKKQMQENIQSAQKTGDYDSQFEDKLDELKQILFQSTPLIPEIEKAFDAGSDLSGRANFRKGTKEYNSYIDKQGYISNLKLNI